jgi:hypothetical protein
VGFVEDMRIIYGHSRHYGTLPLWVLVLNLIF